MVPKNEEAGQIKWRQATDSDGGHSRKIDLKSLTNMLKNENLNQGDQLFEKYFQESCNTSINQRKMSKDLVEDFDENPTTVSGSALNNKIVKIDARSQEQDESKTYFPYHAVGEYEKKLQNHGERIIQDLTDEDDRRKTTTPRHHSQGIKKEDHIYRNDINLTSKKEPAKNLWYES